jgi:hypothetical protein
LRGQRDRRTASAEADETGTDRSGQLAEKQDDRQIDIRRCRFKIAIDESCRQCDQQHWQARTEARTEDRTHGRFKDNRATIREVHERWC